MLIPTLEPMEDRVLLSSRQDLLGAVGDPSLVKQVLARQEQTVKLATVKAAGSSGVARVSPLVSYPQGSAPRQAEAGAGKRGKPVALTLESHLLVMDSSLPLACSISDNATWDYYRRIAGRAAPSAPTGMHVTVPGQTGRPEKEGRAVEKTALQVRYVLLSVIARSAYYLVANPLLPTPKGPARICWSQQPCVPLLFECREEAESLRQRLDYAERVVVVEVWEEDGHDE